MTYMISIKVALLIFPLIAFIFTVPFMLYNYHKYGSIDKFKTLIVYSFIFYLITIYFLVILPLPNREDVTYKSGMIRLVPFTFIKDFIKESSFNIRDTSTYLKALREPCFYTVFFNLLMTVPFGMYLRYYFKKSKWQVLVYTFLLSLFFEVTQVSGLYYIYDYPYRFFDVDDLIINTLGGVLGYYLMGIFKNVLPARGVLDERQVKKGCYVSVLRRVTLFFFDLFLSLFISGLFKDNYIKITIFSLYYLGVPLINNSKTIGGSFLNVKIEYEKNIIISNTLRYLFIFLLFFLGPLILIYIAKEVLSSWVLVLFICNMTLFTYVYSFIYLVRNKKMFYDDLFKSKLVSTIGDKKAKDI